MISVRKANTSALMRDFVRFPERLYDSNPHWVPPLRRSELALLSASVNPALHTVEHVAFIAYQGSAIVGRIFCMLPSSAIADATDRSARFGWCDFQDDKAVSSALFESVEVWAATRSATGIKGPFGFTNLDRAGFLVHGFDRAPTMSTIYNYPYYSDHLNDLGYEKDLEWVEYLLPTPPEVPRRLNDLAEAITRRYSLSEVRIDRVQDVLAYRNQIFDLLDDAYSHLPGYVKFSKQQREWYTTRFLRFVDPRFVSLITIPSGRLVGFAITTPSFSKALQKARGKLFPFGWLHLKRAMSKSNTAADMNLIAVAPDYQSKGVNGLIFRQMIASLNSAGITEVESNPELEGNLEVQSLWRRYDHSHIRTRRTFAKSLRA